MDSGWAAVIVAVIAAAVAAWQAWEARRARGDARSASADAREAADLARRSVKAQERLAAVAEAQVAPAPTWVAHRVDGERWELVNNTGMIVSASILPSRAVRPLDDGQMTLDPGQALTFQWGERADASSFTDLLISWWTTAPGAPVIETTVTLQR
jgi:hypothetical protein